MNNSLKENKIKENIKKLGLTKTNSIGGVRRKKKIHNPIISSRLSEEEKKINKYIDAVNTNSINVNANYIDILNVYINDWFYDLTSGLKRKDFTDKKINIDYLKETEGKLLIPFFFLGCKKYQVIQEVRVNMYHLQSPKHGVEIIITHDDLELGQWYRLSKIKAIDINK